MESPKISIWVTSTGRFSNVRKTVDAFLRYNTYPNVEFLMYESIPNEESKQWFSTTNSKSEECVLYAAGKLEPLILVVDRWKPYGEVMQQLLNMSSGEYYICLEDDLEAVCDPREQFEDAIKLLNEDEHLFGLRFDLSTPMVNENDKRFSGVKRSNVSDYLFWPVAGGGMLIKTETMRKMGGYKTHPLPKYTDVEVQQNTLMRENNMYVGVMLKYYGIFMHIGETSVDGQDHSWSPRAYQQFKDNGWFGKR